MGGLQPSSQGPSVAVIDLARPAAHSQPFLDDLMTLGVGSQCRHGLADLIKRFAKGARALAPQASGGYDVPHKRRHLLS
jgi:hypothetical protein